MVTSEQSDDRRVLDGVVAQLIDGALNIRADDVAHVARATGIATRTITARLCKVGWKSKPDGFGGPIIWLPASDAVVH